MRMTKKFIESLIFFVLSFLLLVVSSLAWFASYNKADVKEVVNTVGKYKVDVKLEVKMGDEDYVEITSHTELEILLQNSIPNDTFQFRLTVVNQSSTDIDIALVFSDFLSQTSEEGYDMLDVFYIIDGQIEVLDEEENSIASYTLLYLDSEDVYVDTTILQLYRFSNLTTNGRLTILNDEPLPYEATRLILFTIKFDQNTENPAYEEASFSINTIEIFLK